MHILHCFIWVAAAYKWGDWRNFQKYYPTMLFFVLGNLTHAVIFYNFPQWFYVSSFLPHNLINIIAAFTIFPSTILLFSPYFPEKLSNKVLYILKWVTLYTLVELFFYSIGLVIYLHKWNIFWSTLHNLYQFPILKLHETKPLLAWSFCAVIFAVIILIFKLPLSSIK
ncbi:hypothetical protein HMPREF1982_01216 [Clostridiales bacterium oral taxon 876 str. F0540]|nr:hypothetical protein HMPREF1982_01216 [Clostridiales bacterium oral taxon 876 str. F0540]